MNKEKKTLILDNEEDLNINDGLSQTAQEVAYISDSELAQQFITYNNDAINNTEAIFNETYVEEANFIFEKHILDEKLKKKLIEDIRKEKLIENQLISDRYIIEYLKKKKNKFSNYFKKFQKNNLSFNKELIQNQTWINYEKEIISIKDKNKLKSNYIQSYFHEHISQWKNFKKILIKKSIFCFAIITFAIINFFILKQFDSSKLTNSQYLKFFNNFQITGYILLSFGLLAMFIPLLYWMILWYVGINNLIFSKNFHFAIFLFLLTGIIFQILSLIFGITIYIFQFLFL